METIAISTPAVSTAVQSNVQSQAGEGQVSFAQLLSGLTGSTTNTGTGTDASATGNLSWREMQAMSQKMLEAQQSTSGTVSVESLLNQLMNLLMGINEEDVSQVLEGDENAENVYASIDKIRRQMEQMMALGGQAGADQQMTLLLAQIYELPLTPQIGEDGTITLTLPQNDALSQLVQTSEPSELLAKLTGLPAESIQKILDVMNGQQAQTVESGQTAGQQTATADVVQAVQVSTQSGGQDAAAAFQSNVQTAKQQMEATAATQTTGQSDTEVDVDELQRQVDEGVHFKNTAYASTVQSEVETEATAKPILTQVQDGILRGLSQGDEQFSIKLMPEGLGELEVRLTKTAEGMLLNIVTKSTEAQKLLTTEIDQLREQMRAYKVEVDSIITAQQDEFLDRQRSFEQQQAWQNGRQSGTARNYRADAGNMDPEALQVQVAQSRLMGNALDTYI